MPGLTLTRLRRTLAEQIDHIRTGGEPVLIYRFGKPVAALVSIEELERIYVAEAEIFEGPVLEKTGHRPGRGYWSKMRESFGFSTPDKGGSQDYSPTFLPNRFTDRVE